MTEIEAERDAVNWWREREIASKLALETDRKNRKKHERRLKKLEANTK